MREGLVMSSWQLQPGAVESVLGRVAVTQSQLSGVHGGDLGEAVVGGLVAASPLTRPVYDAACELVQALVLALGSVNGRVGAGLVGVANAAAAYQMGSREMAVTFQAATSAAVVDGDLSFFERYGVL